ncbi:hypothetical protein ES708_30343 [subsurface metagenome]
MSHLPVNTPSSNKTPFPSYLSQGPGPLQYLACFFLLASRGIIIPNALTLAITINKAGQSTGDSDGVDGDGGNGGAGGDGFDVDDTGDDTVDSSSRASPVTTNVLLSPLTSTV